MRQRDIRKAKQEANLRAWQELLRQTRDDDEPEPDTAEEWLDTQPEKSDDHTGT